MCPQANRRRSRRRRPRSGSSTGRSRLSGSLEPIAWAVQRGRVSHTVLSRLQAFHGREKRVWMPAAMQWDIDVLFEQDGSGAYLCYHHVAVKGPPPVRACRTVDVRADLCDDGGAEGHVGHEMAVHDVDLPWASAVCLLAGIYRGRAEHT